MRLLLAALFAASRTARRGADRRRCIRPRATRSQIEKAFQKSTGDKVRFTFASSGSLARQIENGAPYDVFLSANDKYVSDLAAAGRIDKASVVIYAQGRIALWSPQQHGALARGSAPSRSEACCDSEPAARAYGVAARKALENRGAWKRSSPKSSTARNVRQALQFAESGNADAVITSWTLLIGKGALLPQEWHAPIRQAAGSSRPADKSRRRKVPEVPHLTRGPRDPASRRIVSSGS
jgi:molybdate transport system substrate-binding protein